MYAMDDIIAETHGWVVCFAKPSTMLQLDFANEFGLKMLRCPHLYDDYGLKEIFVEKLAQFIRTASEHTGVAPRLQGCRIWRIKPHR